MPPDFVHAVTLNCHPETPADAVRGIAARVCREPGGRLAVTYALEGSPDRLRVAAPRTPRIASRLWQHTCCEIFIADFHHPEAFALGICAADLRHANS